VYPLVITKEKLESYIFTLEVCKKELPYDAHPAHYERIREITAILKSLAK